MLRLQVVPYHIAHFVPEPDIHSDIFWFDVPVNSGILQVGLDYIYIKINAYKCSSKLPSSQLPDNRPPQCIETVHNARRHSVDILFENSVMAEQSPKIAERWPIQVESPILSSMEYISELGLRVIELLFMVFEFLRKVVDVVRQLFFLMLETVFDR